MSEQEVFNFATIGEIFEDGVSLIFDGQEAATEKHYKVNTSIIFKAGDRVKILADSGTYVVEYVVGPPKQAGEEIVGVPAGGTTGQVLKKSSNNDHAIQWGGVDGTLPSGGAKGQFLVKNSAASHDVSWASPDGMIPSGGTAGQCLIKDTSTNYDVSWGSPAGTIPTGGSKGQCLIKDSTVNYDVSWGSPVANAVVNQYRPTTESYNIYVQTDYSGNFYIRVGTSGAWKKITVT